MFVIGRYQNLELFFADQQHSHEDASLLCYSGGYCHFLVKS